MSVETLRPRPGNESLLRDVCSYVASDPSFGPYVQAKYRQLADPDHGRRYRARLAYEVRVAGATPDGARVLDAGCGAGVYSILLLAHGARAVVGVDYFPHNVRALERIAVRFGLPLRAVLGNVARTPCPAAGVDLVYCLEAISHFHDAGEFLREAARVLRPGGRIVIADGNNGANATLRRRIYAEWIQSETGPFTPDTNPPGDILPYLYRRWMIIRDAFPHLSQEDVFQLGMRTSGLWGPELIEACRRFAERGEWPDRVYGYAMSQRRPEDGQHNEEPIDPRWLVTGLRRLGFRAGARPHFGVSRGRLARWLNDAGALLPAVGLRVAPTYIVHGVKEGGNE